MRASSVAGGIRETGTTRGMWPTAGPRRSRFTNRPVGTVHRGLIALAALFAALLVPTVASATPPSKQVVVDGAFITTTTVTYSAAPLAPKDPSPDMLVDGGSPGYACADANRTVIDGFTSSGVTAHVHACFGNGNLTTASSGTGWNNMACCEPAVHWAGWDVLYFSNDGSQATEIAQGQVQAQAWAGVWFTYYSAHPRAQITVNGWGTVS